MIKLFLDRPLGIVSSFFSLYRIFIWRRVALLSLLLVLGSACSTLPPTTHPAGLLESWRERQSVLTALEDWSLNGRVAVRAGEEGWNARLFWRQAAERYTIDIAAPFNVKTVRIEGDGERVQLRLPENEVVSASDPEALLYRETGVQIPVRGLRFWLVGVPIPLEAEERFQLDEAGRLQWLEQAGWRIDYLDYSRTGSIELPKKLVLSNTQTTVRLFIDRWEVGPPGPSNPL